MENGSRSSRQNLTIEDGGTPVKEKKKKGWHVATPTALFFLALFVAAVIAVALIMWFAIPRKKCPVPTPQQRQEACKETMKEMGRAAVCGPEDKPKDMADDKEEEKDSKEEKPTTGFRLNTSLIPVHYDLELWPRIYDGDDFGFDGNVTTQMMCLEDTNVIVLHVDTVTVHEDTILLKDAQGNVMKVNYTEEDVPRQFYKIYLDQKLMKNQNYSLYMRFNGTTIHDDLLGFYRSNYMENGTEHWIVSTQFEITSTRRCFPLFDENFFKATFTVTMVRRNDFISLGNMPIARTESRGGQWEADIFEKTVVMTPYLLAFSVNQFKYVESFTSRGTQMRVYTQPAMLPYAAYANSIAARTLEAFEVWTGIPYPLPKLDQIVVPDFFFGAMENWGLVVYREEALLYNPEFSDIDQKRIVAYVMAHELAHMWFGNLVTCRWWDDIFLNEAFATYFGYLVGLRGAEPDWEVDEFFMRVTHHILEQDGWHHSQPIRLPNLEHHDGLLAAFSMITYSKGGAVLRMVKEFLGASTFQKGLQKYLNRHAYQTVVDDDLYRALQEQADEDNSVTWDTQKANVTSILQSWVDQQNYPLVSATDLGDGSLKVTQSHFLFEKDQNISFPTPLGSEFLWDIPLTYTDSSMQDAGFEWILRQQESRVQGVAINGWKMVNVDLVGFYRTRYSIENWNKIILQLLTNHTVFSVQNRAGFLDDAFYIAKAGEFPEVEALRATQYLKNERRWLPWYSGVRPRVPYYLDMFFGKPVYDQLEKYLVDLVKPAYNASGWAVESDASNAFTDRYARIVILDTACKMNYKPCVDQAQAQFEQYINDPSNNPIHPDLRGVVYCTAVARGGVREWEFLRSRYEFDYGDVFLAYENYTVEGALACASTPNIIRKYLNYALKQNSTTLFSTIAKKRDARDTVWNYITEHWDDFMDGNKTRITKSSLLTAVTSTWNTMGELRKFADFASLHEEKELAKTYKTIKETIKDNMDWVDTNLEPIENWLTSVNNQQASSPMQMQRRRKRSAAVDVIKDVGDVYGVHHAAPTA